MSTALASRLRPLLVKLVGLLALLFCQPNPPVLVMVVYNSKQRRPVAPLFCRHCTARDIARADSRRGPFPALVLDGHSLPGFHMLGVGETELIALVAAYRPRLLFASTCFGAELGLLERLFAATPELEAVLAAPKPISWTGHLIDDRCLETRGLLAECFHAPAGTQLYTRAQVRSLHRAAEQLRRDIELCRQPPPWVRLYPHYLCVKTEDKTTAVFRVDPHVIMASCFADDPSHRMVSCDRPGDVVPILSAASQ